MTSVVEIVMTGLLGLWMISGVWDNWRFPSLNRAIVARVMRLELLEQDYPDEFLQVAHRRVSNERLISLAFWSIVIWETLAAGLLCLGAGLLALAALGGSDPQLARDIALAGALSFTMIWAGFLIGGNFFCYYFCHFEGQFTHFFLLLWGGLVCVLLS